MCKKYNGKYSKDNGYKIMKQQSKHLETSDSSRYRHTYMRVIWIKKEKKKTSRENIPWSNVFIALICKSALPSLTTNWSWTISSKTLLQLGKSLILKNWSYYMPTPYLNSIYHQLQKSCSGRSKMTQSCWFQLMTRWFRHHPGQHSLTIKSLIHYDNKTTAWPSGEWNNQSVAWFKNDILVKQSISITENTDIQLTLSTMNQPNIDIPLTNVVCQFGIFG